MPSISYIICLWFWMITWTAKVVIVIKLRRLKSLPPPPPPPALAQDLPKMTSKQKHYNPSASEASTEVANLFRPDLDSVLGWSLIFNTKIATQTYSICRGVRNLPHKFHLYLIIIITIIIICSSSRLLHQKFCRPQSMFFPLIKVSPQFLTMGIFTLKPQKLRKNKYV